MKATELRIGNIVQIPFGRILLIDKIGMETVFAHKMDGCGEVGVAVKYLEGVPITPELLGRFGFRPYGAIGWIDGILDVVPGNANDWKCYVGDEHHVTVSINYVHQIQNLYFSLTGEELILSEKTEQED